MLIDDKEKDLDKTPKLSNTEINIATPENINYTEQMSGYYPATYGFENDVIGDIPTDWNVGEDSSTLIEVLSEIDNHKKVVRFYDTTNVGNCEINNTFSNAQDYGTIEFWMRNSDTSYFSAFQIKDKNTHHTLFQLKIDADSFQAFNGSGVGGVSNIILQSANDNIWYHIKVHFETTTGNYQGLSQNTWKALINGIEYGNFGFQYNEDIEKLRFRTATSTSGEFYIDAIGYSWDSNYKIGDNINEGLLLSYTSSISLNWTGYSLDGQVNKTISGNTTISMPNEGRHNIQVFGNNSFGEMFESDIRYFAIKYFPINIITPENKTYTQPMSGFYPATYGFENETGGTSGIDIGFVDIIDSICSVEVVNELDGHLKVLYYNTPIAHRWVRNYFDSSKPSGTVEFWIRLGETNKRHVIYLNDGSGGSISLSWFEDGYVKFDNRTNGGDIEIIEPYNALQWYHVRIEFDVATDWHLWIDGVSKDGGSGYGYVNIPSNFNQLIFGGLEDNNFWLDAVGYSWDPKYNIKDNKNEGILLSYTNRTNLTWIGYSLNGQPNKTILGNTVIPLYRNGNHSIRLYGRNSTGYTFESPLRCYSIDIPAPQILIISPQNGDNFGISAPDFNISITTPILDTSWYTMDNGITKIMFNGLSVTINQLEWDKFGFESITIRFYINDTFGRVSYSGVIINKIPIPPSPPDDVLIILIISMVVGIIIIDLIAIGLIYIRKKKTFIGEKKPKVKKVIKEKPTGKIIISREEITTYQQFKVCPFCKYELKVDYTFCIHCGSKLK